ncbi:MAG: hypothetical protein Q3M24_16445 [Candidatus Electrothrix aestuarii]|uniref:YggT family protein n=1 Tax=Candidatus Electrothrix aestuarii TaxID=3062594 RepID=A0AAU8LRS8_9BACT|nr:hypothetical protein [Candidatus Electrothrix aestuarii]
MWDGLIDVLMSWVSQAWCWLVTQLVAIAFSFIKLIGTFTPSVESPDWLSSNPFTDASLGLIGWIIPFNHLFIAFGFYVTYELLLFVGVPIYRAVMDLF